MAIDRRSLLLGTLAFVGAAPMRGALAMGANDIAYVTAARRVDGSYTVLLLRADGSVLREVPLSGRGHDIAIHRPSNRVAVFARRPGAFAVAFDLETTRQPVVFTPGENRHYFGHGSFSQDGRVLYASENDIDSGDGVIGIYDVASGFKKIGEHPSYGTGPHEIMLLADGKTIAVGNGGLDTVPDAGRENLNVDTMEPSLAFVDRESGKLIAKHTMTGDLQSLSIRHVTQDATGLVWFGAQWEGSPSETPQLVGSAGVDRALKLIEPQRSQGIYRRVGGERRRALHRGQRAESRARALRRYDDRDRRRAEQLERRVRNCARGSARFRGVIGLRRRALRDCARFDDHGARAPRHLVRQSLAARRLIRRDKRCEISAGVDVGEGSRVLARDRAPEILMLD